MRNRLRLSEAARTKCSGLIWTPIVWAATQTENRAHNKKVNFSEGEKKKKMLFIYRVTSLPFTKACIVFNKLKFARVTLRVRSPRKTLTGLLCRVQWERITSGVFHRRKQTFWKSSRQFYISPQNIITAIREMCWWGIVAFNDIPQHRNRWQITSSSQTSKNF